MRGSYWLHRQPSGCLEKLYILVWGGWGSWFWPVEKNLTKILLYVAVLGSGRSGARYWLNRRPGGWAACHFLFCPVLTYSPIFFLFFSLAIISSHGRWSGRIWLWNKLANSASTWWISTQPELTLSPASTDQPACGFKPVSFSIFPDLNYLERKQKTPWSHNSSIFNEALCSAFVSELGVYLCYTLHHVEAKLNSFRSFRRNAELRIGFGDVTLPSHCRTNGWPPWKNHHYAIEIRNWPPPNSNWEPSLFFNVNSIKVCSSAVMKLRSWV